MNKHVSLKCKKTIIIQSTLVISNSKGLSEIFRDIRSSTYQICKKTIIIQSTLVISNSKGLSEIFRDIRSSTYQVCRIEEKII